MNIVADDDATSVRPRPRIGLLGAVVGRYRLVSRIGRGATSEVYLAEHTDPSIERRVAVKILRAECCDEPSAVEHAIDEARALARFHHPAIVEVLDVAFTADGRPCLIMELVRGESLRELLDRHGPVSASSAIAITWQVADAMAAAHAAGIVHRDLRPENVYLLPSHDGVRLKLLDFALTASRRDDDVRTDVHGVGGVLFELVTGRPVSDQDTPPLGLLASMSEVTRALAAMVIARPVPSRPRWGGWLVVGALAVVAIAAGLVLAFTP